MKMAWKHTEWINEEPNTLQKIAEWYVNLRKIAGGKDIDVGKMGKFLMIKFLILLKI
jgi:hypothetical protein